MKSLRYKFIFSFLSIEILFISLIVFFNFSSLSKLSKSLVDENIATSTSLFEEMVKTPMAIYDLGTLDDQTKSFTHMKNIVSVKIVDNQNRVLSESRSSDKINFDTFSGTSAEQVKEGRTYRLISLPIRYKNDLLGTAQIVYEITESLQTIQHNQRMTFALIGLEIIISSFVAFLIGLNLTRDLDRLTQTAKNIAEDEETALPENTGKSLEIHILFHTLHTMQDKIVERKKKLLETLDALQDDIRLRSELEQHLISERNLAEQNRQKFETIFERSRDGIAILDLESNFLEFNNAYLLMTGFTREELLTQSCISLSRPEDRDQAREAIRTVLEQGYIESLEKTCIVKDGKAITVKMGIALMPDKKRLLINTSDITHLKKIESELINANKAKSDFLANMSHELRTPLNAILGFSQMMHKTVDEKQKKTVEHILTAGKHLLSLINDILDIARVEAGKVDIHIETVSLAELISDVEAITETLASDKGLYYHLEIKENIILSTDPRLLKQIIINQISNSIKFTESGGITIQAYRLGDKANIIIRDTGIGISREDLKKLFNEFIQINNGLQKYGKGSGLGLVLSKRYSELLGGDLILESVEGQGTSAHIVIPINYAQPARNQ